MSKKYFLLCLVLILIFLLIIILLTIIEEKQIEEKQCNEDYKLIKLDESISFCYPKTYGDPEIEIINKEKTRELSESMKQDVRIEGECKRIFFKNAKLNIILETIDFCIYYWDELFDKNVCRNIETYEFLTKCVKIDNKGTELCESQTYRNSYKFILRKKIELKKGAYSKVIFEQGVDNRTYTYSEKPKLEELKVENEKIKEFINIWTSL